MDFSISQLLILLFFLLPLIERFFNKKKNRGRTAEPVEADDDDIQDLSWEETLERLDTVLKGEAEVKPAPRPALDREFQVGAEPARPLAEFRNLAPKPALTEEERAKLYSDFKVVDYVDPDAMTIRLDHRQLRESIVVNEILMPPVSMRPHRRSA